MIIMQSHMYLRNYQKTCHIGAMLLLWLRSMLAALSRVNDPDSRANSADSVHPLQKQAQTPSTENTPVKENIGHPCTHEHKQLNSAKDRSLCTRTVHPHRNTWLVKQNPIPTQTMPLVGMIGAEIVQ